MAFPDVDPTDGEITSAPRIAEPERRLFFAVLTDAIVRVRQLAAGRRAVRHELLEAERWIRSDDRTWPCSFVNVCSALDIAHEPLRRAVLRWRLQRPANEKRATRRGLLVENKGRRRNATATCTTGF